MTIYYKPGRENIPVDALSRDCLMAWSEAQFKWSKHMPKLTREDAELNKLLIQNTQDTLPLDKFVVKYGMILRRGRLMIPANSKLKNLILQEFHDSKVGGHARKFIV